MNCENKAHIIYASDDKFSEILGVSLVSLYENSKDLDEICVYVLDSGISNDNKGKLQSISVKYNRNDLIWLEAKNISEELAINVEVDRGSLSQYARLFVSSSLPDELERVLYLDCDIIINKSISEIWQLDLKDKTIGALMDAFSKHYRVNIELNSNDIMFNSGVMLIDLNKWKEQNVEKRLLEFIKNHKGKIQQGDQGTLNSILSHDTYCFEPRFNSVTIFYDFSYKEIFIYRKPPFFYSPDEIKMAVEAPVLIHFTTSFLSIRPWYKGCKHIYTDKWLYYKKISPWAESSLWKKNEPTGINKLFSTLIHKLPRGIMLRIAGFLQIYGRPFKNRISK